MTTLRCAVLGTAALVFSQTAAAVSINEFQPNPVGADPAEVQVELLGNAFDSFTGVLLSIESDGSSAAGTVDRVSQVSGTFDANGLLVVTVPDLENPSFTLVLLDTFSGDVGTVIDTDNDGIADDLSTFGTVFDAIGIPDAVSDEAFVYGEQLGGQDFAFTGDEPQLVFRDSATLEWFAINDPAGTDAFDINGNAVPFANFNADPSVTTFGAVNPAAAVPVPAAAWLMVSALGFLGFGARRKV
ncbi:MAG: hypothetical protein AAFN78_06785 [Pseudomonadota bacterium]